MLTVLDARNPVYGDANKTFVNLEVLFEELQGEGYLPFTAKPDDPEPHGRIIFMRAVAGEFGGSPGGYVAPPVTVPENAPAFGIRSAMNVAGVRSSFESFVTQSSYENKDYWEYEPVVLRSHPIWLEWIQWAAFTPARPTLIDDLFIAANQ